MAGIKLTTKEFIAKSKLIHGDTYMYNNTTYNGNKIKVNITCKEHGDFLTIANNHLCGTGCPKCAVNFRISKKTKTKESFITEANKKHNYKFDYSLVEYINNYTKVKITCPEHGLFEQSPKYHLKGIGCSKCAYDSFRLKEIDFINQAKEMHGDKYIYNNIIYVNFETPVEIICKKHGPFFQRSHKHLSGQECPNCKSSKGENEIELFLKENKIIFERQKRFDDCKNKKPLPFDFYLPDKNICIEYDGELHFKAIDFFGGEKGFLACKKNDLIKNEYCKSNNITLIRIKYNENILNYLKKI